MSRSMAYHDAERCGGLVSCTVCLDRVWNGRTPVMTPWLDQLFLGFATVTVAAFALYMCFQVARAIVRAAS